LVQCGLSVVQLKLVLMALAVVAFSLSLSVWLCAVMSAGFPLTPKWRFLRGNVIVIGNEQRPKL